VVSFLLQMLVPLFSPVSRCLRRWVKPDNRGPLVNPPLDLTRSKADLIIENSFLRHHLVVLYRQVKRPRLRRRDRLRLVLLASCLRGWKQALLIVQPETLLRWHRELFRRVWRRKSRAGRKPGRPPLSESIVSLVVQMAQENRTWGAERIRGELLRLGTMVSKSTIQKYMRQVRQPASPQQTWLTFLHNHMSEIWACDFLQTYDLFFRALFVFIIIELGSRRVVYAAVTRNPSGAWVAKQLRNATPFGEGPRYLIRDNDSKYGASFGRMAAGTGIRVLRTPYGAPRANAICEQFLGTLRRECLDHFLVLSEGHLYRVVQAYQGYFSCARPHQGIEQHLPCPPESLPENGYCVAPGTGWSAPRLSQASGLASLSPERIPYEKCAPECTLLHAARPSWIQLLLATRWYRTPLQIRQSICPPGVFGSNRQQQSAQLLNGRTFSARQTARLHSLSCPLDSDSHKVV